MVTVSTSDGVAAIKTTGTTLAVKGARILVLGLTYKRNSADARESPAVDVVERLLGLGATVRCCDPHVSSAGVPAGAVLVELSENEVASSDAVLILTDHDEFDFELVTRAARYIFDVRYRLHSDRVEHL